MGVIFACKIRFEASQIYSGTWILKGYLNNNLCKVDKIDTENTPVSKEKAQWVEERERERERWKWLLLAMWTVIIDICSSRHRVLHSSSFFAPKQPLIVFCSRLSAYTMFAHRWKSQEFLCCNWEFARHTTFLLVSCSALSFHLTNRIRDRLALVNFVKLAKDEEDRKERMI